MTVYEKARELGELLLETEQAKRLTDARYIFDGDEQAQKALFDYTEYRNNVVNKMEDGSLKPEQYKEEAKKINEMAKELKNTPIVGDMLKAESEFNSLVNQVMEILKVTINGEEETSGCTGNCSGCSGCH